MDTNVEVPAEIYLNSVSDEIMGKANETVLNFQVFDQNEPGYVVVPNSKNSLLSVTGVSSPLLALGEYNEIVLARDATSSEIGVVLHGHLTVTDDTGQQTTSDFDFEIVPVERIINGTAAADYMATNSYQTNRILTLNGLGGNDTMYAYKAGTTLDGGADSDTLWGMSTGLKLIGGTGNDTLYTYNDNHLYGGLGKDIFYQSGSGNTFHYDAISESNLIDYKLSKPSSKSGQWDTIYDLHDNDTIDLTGLGHIEWDDRWTDQSSVRAHMVTTNNVPSFFLIDTDRDGDYDFGIELKNVHATQAVHFEGLVDWLI
jgi:Ca2+-binding RTX toxin-like protein